MLLTTEVSNTDTVLPKEVKLDSLCWAKLIEALSILKDTQRFSFYTVQYLVWEAIICDLDVRSIVQSAKRLHSPISRMFPANCLTPSGSET